jgi:Holliday junction resolvasome RuvABC endonuclease subunit
MYTTTLEKTMTIYIGMDLSLVSPGISVYETCSDRYVLYGFAQRVRERGFKWDNGTTSIVLLPAIPNSPTTVNEQRYEHIRHHIVDTIMSPYKDITDVVVGFEGYAFGATSSGSSYKLQELGGILKHSIWTQYPQWSQYIIPPTQWKKVTIGHGRASKKDVVDYVFTHAPKVPLLDILGLVVSKNGDIPCPAQDLADAACLSFSLSLPSVITKVPKVPKVPKVQKKRKKRKRDDPTVSNLLSFLD